MKGKLDKLEGRVQALEGLREHTIRIGEFHIRREVEYQIQQTLNQIQRAKSI
jgi:hypothetical protein